MNRLGRLVVVSGPSGVGKSTLIRRLLRHDKCRLAVSATTRQPREGEVEGVHYRFMGRRDFETLRDQGLLLEHAEVHGALYGTPKAEVQPWLDRGWTVILDVDAQGFRSVRKLMPVLGVFVTPPSESDLAKRLHRRATEDDEARARRLENARNELLAANEYDHVIVNDDVDDAVRRMELLMGLGPS